MDVVRKHVHSSPSRRFRNGMRRKRRRLELKIIAVLDASVNFDTMTTDSDMTRPECDDIPTGFASFGQLYMRSLQDFVSASHCSVVESMRLPLKAGEGKRCRDIFPLPRIDAKSESSAMVGMINMSLAGLNCLHSGGRRVAFAASAPTSAQRGVIEHVISRCKRLTSLFDSIEENMAERTVRMKYYEQSGKMPYPKLVAGRVDLPCQAATCDPTPLSAASLQQSLRNVSTLVPRGRVGHKTSRIRSSDYEDYLALTCIELKLGKLSLSLDALGVGSLFAVPKSTPGRLRCIWNGHLISEASACPPKPRRLGNPTALLSLDVEGDRFWLSKRDAASFFDVLQCPQAMRRWFGRPAIRAADLARGLDCSLAGLFVYACDLGLWEKLTKDTMIYPCSNVWPMGYAWSSAVAQDVTLGILRESGISECQVLCDSEPPPINQEECVIVQTDDTIFIHSSPDAAGVALSNFDTTMSLFGIPRRIDKDVNAADELVGLGCKLSGNPSFADPAPDKLWPLVNAILDLDKNRCASPAGLSSLCGVAQWFCLLSRPHFSVFNAIYEFNRQMPLSTKRSVPADVVDELCLFVSLAPLLAADFALDYIPLITACDASPQYGFGASVATANKRLLASLAKLSERRGDFIRLQREGDVEAECEKFRIGTSHLLELRKADFHDVLCIKAAKQEHSSAMEARAVHLMLRWISRKLGHQHKRLILLCDAKAVLGAIAKGRSSSPRLRYIVSQIGALLLALDIRLHLVYVPSEDNPGDKPSRGSRRRPVIRRYDKKQHRAPFKSKLERYLEQLDESYRRLKETGMIHSSGSRTSSDSS